MFGGKGQPILPTQGLDSAYIDRYMSASETLLRRALNNERLSITRGLAGAEVVDTIRSSAERGRVGAWVSARKWPVDRWFGKAGLVSKEAEHASMMDTGILIIR